MMRGGDPQADGVTACLSPKVPLAIHSPSIPKVPLGGDCGCQGRNRYPRRWLSYEGVGRNWHEDNAVRIVLPRHQPGPTGHPIVDAVGAGLRARFAKTAEEPIPEHLIALVQRIDDAWSTLSNHVHGSDDDDVDLSRH